MALRWVFFDMNGTLLDPAGIADPLGGGHDERQLVEDALDEAILLAMADTLSGDYRPLAEHLAATLERRLRVGGRDTSALDQALERAKAMDPFPEAATALDALGNTGLRLGVLTNSPTVAAERSLEHARLRERFDAVIGTDAVGAFKPDARVYRHALESVDVRAEEACLVAAHGWDVMGAMRAGMHGAWVSRKERWLMPTLPKPDVVADDLEAAAQAIMARLGESR